MWVPSLTRRQFLAGAAAIAVWPHPPARSPASADAAPEFDSVVPTAWFDLALTLTRTTPGFSPPVAARAFGYAGVTLYEAVVPGAPRYRSLAGVLPGLPRLPPGRPRLCWPEVANAALADILRRLFVTTSDDNKAMIDSLEDSLAHQITHGRSPSVVHDSVGRGRLVAQVVHDWSRGDGGDEGYLRNFPADYTPPAGPGLWVPTPVGFQSALQPYWGANRCFAVAGGAACPSGDPTPFSPEPTSQCFAEAVEVREAVNGLTAEQEATARFWSDDPGVTATPPGHTMSITSQVLRQEGASLMTAAETYAKVGMAVADSFVVCWNTKYRYNVLRPVTYIQNLIDPGWLPLLDTPPFPEFSSGHSVQSAAGFGVLADLFGDDYRFADHTHDSRGLVPRQFDRFSEAAAEAASSRLYGGIHFRPAIELGIAQGRCVADAVGALPFRRGANSHHPQPHKEKP